MASLAFARHIGMAAETPLPHFKDFEYDLPTLASLLEAVRVRVGTTAEGGVSLEEINDE